VNVGAVVTLHRGLKNVTQFFRMPAGGLPDVDVATVRFPWRPAMMDRRGDHPDYLTLAGRSLLAAAAAVGATMRRPSLPPFVESLFEAAA
jgi:hypothetical protein